MTKKILFYALGLNLISSFLGALAYKYLCDANIIFCGDIVNANHSKIFFPTVISGSIFIIIAYFVTKWTKLPILFFLVPVILAAIFNISGEESPNINTIIVALVVGILPVLIAISGAWLIEKAR